MEIKNYSRQFSRKTNTPFCFSEKGGKLMNLGQPRLRAEPAAPVVGWLAAAVAVGRWLESSSRPSCLAEF
jgi:hypothetical protein